MDSRIERVRNPVSVVLICSVKESLYKGSVVLRNGSVVLRN